MRGAFGSVQKHFTSQTFTLSWGLVPATCAVTKAEETMHQELSRGSCPLFCYDDGFTTRDWNGYFVDQVSVAASSNLLSLSYVVQKKFCLKVCERRAVLQLLL